MEKGLINLSIVRRKNEDRQAMGLVTIPVKHTFFKEERGMDMRHPPPL